MLPGGKSSWPILPYLVGRLFFQRHHWETGRFLVLFHPAEVKWRSFEDYWSGQWWLVPILWCRAGLPQLPCRNVRCWEREDSATPRCSGRGLWLVQAWGPAPRMGTPACSCRLLQRTWVTVLLGVALQMFTFPPSQELLLPVISPLRRCSGRSPSYWPAGRQTRLQKPMPIFRRLQFARLKNWNLFLCSGTWDAAAVKFLHHVARGVATRTGKIRLHAPASCSKTPGSPFGRTRLEQRCGATCCALRSRAALQKVPIESRRFQHGWMSLEPLRSQCDLQFCRKACLPAIFATVFPTKLKGASLLCHQWRSLRLFSCCPPVQIGCPF